MLLELLKEIILNGGHSKFLITVGLTFDIAGAYILVSGVLFQPDHKLLKDAMRENIPIRYGKSLEDPNKVEYPGTIFRVFRERDTAKKGFWYLAFGFSLQILGTLIQ